MQNENILYKIPTLSINPVKTTVLGIIDSSGSMSGCWSSIARNWNQIVEQNENALCITFSNSAAIVKGPLSLDIHKHGGGGTEIESGFRELNSILKADPNIYPNLTIIFISDGQDNNSKTLNDRLEKLSFHIDKTKKCNFLSMGVGTYFPTFVAMKLRDIYHNGDPNLPPVFLIEKVTDELIAEQFVNLNPYLIQRNSYNVSPKVKIFPWEKPTEKVNENQWILTDFDELNIDGKHFLIKENKISINEMIDIARNWLQELQLLSIKKSVKEEAEIAINLLQEKKYKLDVGKPKGEKLTFFERMMKKQGNELLQTLSYLIKEIKSFSGENLLSKLNESEAAKRLAIGTKVGKYHSKAIDLRGLTVDDYVKIKNNFIQLLETFPLNPESSQEPSVISMQNQKDIFLEDSFKDGISLCPSQYDLVEEMPLIGHALKVHRSDGTGINPWLIQVVSIARHHKVLDSVSIQKNQNEIKLKVGQDDEEVINAVLPLFSEKDYDLKPFINSKLYHLLMTFNVMQNVDTLFENAYAALLGAALTYLLNQEESEWRNDLIILIRKTLSITYANSKGFKTYCDVLMENSNKALVTDHPDNPVKCEDLSKAILALDYVVFTEENLKEEKIEEILNRIFIEYFGRNYLENTPLFEYFEIVEKDLFEKIDLSGYRDKILEKIKNVEIFYTKYELRDKLLEEIKNLNIKIDIDYNIKLDLTKIYKKFGKINLYVLEKIYEYYLEKKIDTEKYIFWINHAHAFRNSYERNTTDILYDRNAIIINLKRQFESDYIKNNSIYNDLWPIYETKHKEFIIKSHQKYPLPLLKENLQDLCKKKGKKFEENLYQFNSTSNLLKNACMYEECPFYMEFHNSLAQHLVDNKYSLSSCPAFHKTIKILCNSEKSADEILNHIKNGDYLDKNINIPPIPDEWLKNLENHKNIMLEAVNILVHKYRKIVSESEKEKAGKK